MLEEVEGQQWPFVPFVSVGPLRFGMSRDQVVEHVAAALDAVPTVEVLGDWVLFSLPTSFSRPLTAYFSASEGLACVAIDACHGPQITLRHLCLVGQVPSKLEDEFSDYMSAKGWAKPSGTRSTATSAPMPLESFYAHSVSATSF